MMTLFEPPRPRGRWLGPILYAALASTCTVAPQLAELDGTLPWTLPAFFCSAG